MYLTYYKMILNFVYKFSFSNVDLQLCILEAFAI